MTTTTELLNEINSTWHEMMATLEDNKRNNTVKIAQLNARLDALELAGKRPLLPGMSGVPGYDPTTPPNPDIRLFLKAVAVGGPNNLRDPDERSRAERLLQDIETKAGVGPAEAKALSLGDDTTGGFLAPSELAREIIKGVQLISPVRQYARVRPTSFRSVQVPVRSGTFAAQWTGEMVTRAETTGLSWSLEELTPYEMYALVLISQQDLEDSAFDLQAEIASEAAEQFAKAEGAAFVNGSSVKQPEGFMTNAAIAHVASGSASAVTADGLINLVYALKEAYAARATLFLKRETVGAIRLLKDSYDRYVWEPNYQAGSPPTILGIPYAEVPDMPSVTGSAFPVAVGDWSRGYQIVDRVDMSVQRLNEKYAEQGQIGFLIRKRVGGQVVLPEAIKKLEIALS